MPALYAHKIYGARVYNELPAEIKKIIAENKEEFLIGLHGPDVLFFNMSKGDRVSKVGSRLHRRPFAVLEKRAFKVLKEEKDEAALSYFIGCICHFVLDSKCHPLVDAAVAATGMSHGKIEMELERKLLSDDGHEPLSYPGHAHLPVSRRTAEKAALFYKDISAHEFFMSMLGMKAVYAACNRDSVRYKRILTKIMNRIGYGNKISSLLMSRDRSRTAEEYTETISEALYACVEDGVSEICDFTASLVSGDERLTSLARKNFMGKDKEHK